MPRYSFCLRSFSLAVLAALWLAACQAAPGTPATSVSLPAIAGGEPASTPTAGEAISSSLPAAPQAVMFPSRDNETLQGTYYPAASDLAPLVVLMHWAPGDQADWAEIACWLQNRGLGGHTPNPLQLPWLDSSWFPLLAEGRSYAVFTFTFRGCQGGCKASSREQWLQDAQAALEYATMLPGVDAQRVVAVGASMGADGALDACLWLNTEGGGVCRGALSLSPGSYLTLPYPQAVQNLGALQPPPPAWCLYAKGDSASAAACQTAPGEHFRAVEYAGDPHGMKLIAPGLQPGALELLLEFLEMALK